MLTTGTKFGGRLTTHNDVQLIVDALALQEEIIPESRFRKLLPGQMYGQVVNAPESQLDITTGFSVYQIPQIELGKTTESLDRQTESQRWFESKYKTALMNYFQHIQMKKWGKQPSQFQLKEMEWFLSKEITKLNI